MSKLDTIRQFRDNIAESMGAGTIRGEVMPGASAMTAAPARIQGLTKVKNVAEIPLDKIDRDHGQPREEFDGESLARLAKSMETKGQLQPIRVRWDEGRGAYVILCGERRWRAAKLAGMATMTAIIVEGELPPAELLALQVIENALREDLKPIEQARAYKQLMGLNGWSTTQVGKELAIDQSSVSRALKLLDLPEPVQDLVELEALAPRTAYEVSKLDHPQDQVELAEQIAREGMTRDAVVEAVQARKIGRQIPAKAARADIRLDDGFRISIVGQGADGGPEILLEVLRRATRKLQAEVRSAAQGRGEAA